jgi:hypothetical protein
LLTTAAQLRFDRISLVYGGNHSASDFDRAFLRYRTLAEQMQSDHMDMLQETLNDIDRRAHMVREETLRAAGVQQPASRRKADAFRAPVTPIQENASSALWATDNRADVTVAQFSSVGQSPATRRPDATRALVNLIPDLPSSACYTIHRHAESTVPRYSSIVQGFNARWAGSNPSPIDFTEEDGAERTVAGPESIGKSPTARQVGPTLVLASPVRENAFSTRWTVRDGTEGSVAWSSSIGESSIFRRAGSTRAPIDLTEEAYFSASQAFHNGAEHGVARSSSAARQSPTAQAVQARASVDFIQQNGSSARQNITHGAESPSAARVVTPHPPATPVDERHYLEEQTLCPAAGHGFRGGVATSPGFLDDSFFAGHLKRSRPGSVNYDPESNNHWRCNAFGALITPRRSLEVGMHNRQIGGPVVTRETLEVSTPVNQPEFPIPFGPHDDDTTDTYEMTDIEARQHEKSALGPLPPGGDIGNHILECGYRPPFFDQIP